MDEKKLRAEIELGRQAEDLKRYLEGNPYLYQVFERIKLGIWAQILSLKPSEHEAFASLKARHDYLYDPLACIDHDILIGQNAMKALESGKESSEGGIL